MEIQNYFDDLKRLLTEDIHEAKERFFKIHWRYAKSRSKMETQLRAKNIPFTYMNSEHTQIRFRLTNIGVTCNDCHYDVTVYNSLGENIMDLKFHLIKGTSIFNFFSHTSRPCKSLQQNLKIQRGKFTYYFLIYKGLK